MKVLILVSSIVLAFSSARAADCNEQYNFKFVSEGKEVVAENIGADNRCDEFGGSVVFTPKNHVRVYVNYSIEGTLDLDKVDAAFDKSLNNPYSSWFKEIGLSIVSKKWAVEKRETNRDAFLGTLGDTLFLTDILFVDGAIYKALNDFYSMR